MTANQSNYDERSDRVSIVSIVPPRTLRAGARQEIVARFDFEFQGLLLRGFALVRRDGAWDVWSPGFGDAVSGSICQFKSAVLRKQIARAARDAWQASGHDA